MCLCRSFNHCDDDADDEDNEDDGEEFLIEEAPKDPLVSLDPDPMIEVTRKHIF